MPGSVIIHAAPGTPGPKCCICGSLLVLGGWDREDGRELLRLRCIDNCRGSDVLLERRIPSLPEERRFDWKAEAKKDQHAHNHSQFFVERTLTCAACRKTVTGKFHPHAKTCCAKCSANLNRITAHKRWLRIRKKKGAGNGRKK